MRVNKLKNFDGYLLILAMTILAACSGSDEQASDKEDPGRERPDTMILGDWCIVRAGGEVAEELKLDVIEHRLRFNEGGSFEWYMSEVCLDDEGSWKWHGDKIKISVLGDKMTLKIKERDKYKIDAILAIYFLDVGGPVTLERMNEEFGNSLERDIYYYDRQTEIIEEIPADTALIEDYFYESDSEDIYIIEEIAAEEAAVE